MFASRTATRIYSLSLSNTKQLALFLPLQSLSALKELDITTVDPSQAPMVSEVLSKCKQSLRHLGLVVHIAGPSVPRNDQIQCVHSLIFTPLPCLQSMELTFPIVGSIPKDRRITTNPLRVATPYLHIPASKFLIEFLTSFPQPLKELTLSLDYRSVLRIPVDVWTDWRALDGALQSFARGGSCQLTFAANRIRWGESEQSCFQESLPSVFQKGLATFQPYD